MPKLISDHEGCGTFANLDSSIFHVGPTYPQRCTELLSRFRQSLVTFFIGRWLLLFNGASLAAVIWIIGFSTSEGELVVVADIDNVDVVISAQGYQVAIINEDSGPRIKLQCGQYQLELKNNPGDFQLNQDQITVERGVITTVKVTRQQNKGVFENISTHDTARHAQSRPTVPAVITVPPKNIIESQSTGMKLTIIPAGTFMMGSPPEEPGRTIDEGPQHAVEISRPFYIGLHEVTQDEYQTVTGRNPSWFSVNGGGKSKVSGEETSRLPIESVSWYDAIQFCNKLSDQDGFSVCYNLTDVIRRADGTIRSATVTVVDGTGYRLPTEAEWEYACRGTTVTPFSIGDVLNGENANVNGNQPYGTFSKGTGLKRPTTVGSYVANQFGLYDMCGNVWEWCFDNFDEDAYATRGESTKDPVVTTRTDTRVLRGGSWVVSPSVSRAASRFGFTPNVNFIYFGFRVVRAADYE